MVGRAFVLAGVLEPDGLVDRHALIWHVLLWDLWFLLWRFALAVATWRSGTASKGTTSTGTGRERAGG